jgi:hypothetical protein
VVRQRVQIMGSEAMIRWRIDVNAILNLIETAP